MVQLNERSRPNQLSSTTTELNFKMNAFIMSKSHTLVSCCFILTLVTCCYSDSLGQQLKTTGKYMKQMPNGETLQLVGGPGDVHIESQEQPQTNQISSQNIKVAPPQQRADTQEAQTPQVASVSSSARLRTPRSIGDVFKKFFGGNKRSKPSQSSRNEWDQQQQQQMQQQQSQLMAAQMANQQAVYGSPFAAYSPQASGAASGLYPQFSPYSSAGLVAWPSSGGIAQTLRATPTLIGAPSMPAAVTIAANGGSPLYAAASQSYNSYAAPPPSSMAVGQSPQSSAAAQMVAAANAGPTAAASHAHHTAVPGPSVMSSGGSPSSIDFHQVLDAFVRTSGFAPAGDQEAAAASGYGPKSDATPVFSFKKLVSLPFYLSTEEKSLDGLANAMAPAQSAGYSLHSMPIMRRHVRRMSSPSSQIQQQQLGLSGAYMSDSQLQRVGSERAQQQHYTNYFNALNNQLMQYLGQQQSLSTTGAQQQAAPGAYEMYSPETAAALANYQAALNGLNSPSLQHKSQSSNSRGSGANLAMAASVATPMTVAAPQGAIQSQQVNQNQVNVANQRQQYDQQELQSLLNTIQQAASAESGYSNPSIGAQISPSLSSSANQMNDGHRFGAHPQYFWPANYQQHQSIGAEGQSNPNLDYPAASGANMLAGLTQSISHSASDQQQQANSQTQQVAGGQHNSNNNQQTVDLSNSASSAAPLTAALSPQSGAGASSSLHAVQSNTQLSANQQQQQQQQQHSGVNFAGGSISSNINSQSASGSSSNGQNFALGQHQSQVDSQQK